VSHDTPLLEATLAHLATLVAFDTRNPPRTIGRGMFDWLAGELAGFECDLRDLGAGCWSLHARRGQPDVLFNVHLDTVPASPAWTSDPHVLQVADGRATGLGACDTKGAAAALLAAVQASDGDAALLFTCDEEANDPRGVAQFLATDHGYASVVVAEPTRGEAVLAHRGIAAVEIAFQGVAGHASGETAMQDSAVHRALRWGVDALALADAEARERFGGLTGLRFNIGRVEGGIKANVVAPACTLRFGFRPLPSHDVEALHARLAALAPEGSRYTPTFRGPALPAGDTAAAEDRRLAARDLAEHLGLDIGNAVDFWTEASLFSAAGLTALVYGPGDIAQAHTADEWVALDQLAAYAASVHRIFSRTP
jgi:acetylornithine deacetylase